MDKIKSKFLTIRLTEDDYTSLKELAWINDISMAALIRRMIRKELTNYETSGL